MHPGIHYTIAESTLGSVLIARSPRGICAILPGDDPERLIRDAEAQFPGTGLSRNDAELRNLAGQVIAFLDGAAIGLDLPLDIRGTDFQRQVWAALREIPLGATASYAEIATRIGAPGSVRAVARACAANTLAVAIPCHRVIRSDGELAGYRWGLERKRVLLAREAAAATEAAPREVAA